MVRKTRKAKHIVVLEQLRLDKDDDAGYGAARNIYWRYQMRLDLRAIFKELGRNTAVALFAFNDYNSEYPMLKVFLFGI